ncbi:uncharacterized protein LOC143846603 [Tasmannia lanceolata]|uniref:uncharacterized protein LOC143846603 n=1 Tax=Tasmannia lanceolata TaxID=3420 RepID=UPI00406294F2
MYTCLTNIVNELEGLGNVYTNEEIVNKLLRSIPASWDPNITAIEEAKNLGTILLEELVGSLITHEMKMKKRADQQGQKDDTKKKGVDFKAKVDSESESEGEKFQNLGEGNVNTDKWYLDSGCSRHMTGDPSKFSSITMGNQGKVTFGDDKKEKIIGEGTITFKDITISNVLLVDDLAMNLFSISQLCDVGNEVTFRNDKCIVKGTHSNTISFTATRNDNVYTLALEELTTQNVKCLSSIDNNSWTWHRRLGHAHMKLLSKLCNKESVTGLPKLKYSNDHVFRACQKGKQAKDSFKPKTIVSYY